MLNEASTATPLGSSSCAEVAGVTIAAIALRAIARYGIDGCADDLANAVVVGVGDIDVVVGVDSHRGGRFSIAEVAGPVSPEYPRLPYPQP